VKRKIAYILERIPIFLKDKNRKSLLRIGYEALDFWRLKKEIPFYYFGKSLYRKKIHNYRDYLGSKEIDLITFSKKLHLPNYTVFLRNKLAFAKLMEASGFNVPKTFSHNFRNHFFQNSEVSRIITLQELADFYIQLFDVQNTEKVFVKPLDEMGGLGCFLLTKNNIETELKGCGQYILTHDCIHQAAVDQHEKVNSMYPHSLNTIRFYTYIDKKGEIHILSAFMRFGCGGSYVDNAGAGGMYVAIDLEEGKLKGKSHERMKHGGKQLEAHPDTKVLFNNWKIPYFEDAKALVKQAVMRIPNRIIGWDIGISQEGPVIIEGNENSSFVGPDIAYGGYLKHPLFKEILEEA
jgi:hypothetical protein